MTPDERRELILAATTAAVTTLVASLVNWAVEVLKARSTAGDRPSDEPSTGDRS